ncbi:ABEC1 enzyme, partial [Chaetorhynchus papuensis]|nr:ABEC1 enzyme [Chaetorhynchus papuensis]
LKLLFCCSMYVSESTLGEQFDPDAYPKETYLLCELRWGNSKRSWKHWVRNDNHEDCHAEKCFLEKIFELRSSKFCYITWYLSWSPCAKCCHIIWDFLEEHPNVKIDIRVARLYNIRFAETRRCLRELALWQDRVTINVNHLASVSADYRYCWETFIRKDYVSLPRNFQRAITRNRLKLKKILEVSTL